jgi:hypothetical protein
MEFKGTKGKWEVNENLEIISGSNIIADCNWLTHFDEANAKLIASAPEMLEMLKQCVETLEFGGQIGFTYMEAKQLIKEVTEI